MNVFEKHGVDYVSASLINGWIGQPALTLLKIAGISDKAGPAAWRGIASEHGINIAAEKLDWLTIDNYIDAAQRKFDEIHSESDEEHNPEKVQKERKYVADYVTQGINFLGDFMGDCVETPLMQGKVRYEIDDLPVPVLGYYDMLFKNPNYIVDIKTSAVRPSKPSFSHARQLAVYWAGTGAEPWVWYINRSGVSTFTIHKPEVYFKQFISAAKSLERVLSYSDDIFECCQLVYPDIDHWMWGETTRSAAKDIWKMEL